MNSRHFIVGLLSALCLTPSAYAHRGLSADIKINLEKETLRLETSVSAKELASTFDIDGDGQVSKSEFVDQESDIQNWLTGFVQVRDDDGARLVPVFEDNPIPHFTELAPADAVEGVRVIRRYELDAETSPCVQLSDQASGERRLLTATAGAVRSVSILKPDMHCRPLQR